MWEKLTYPKKCIFIFAVFILFLVTAYQFTFKDTFRVLSEIKEKEGKIAWLQQKEEELPVLRSKMALIESSYSEGDSISVRDKLTALISDFAENNDCVVTEIPSSFSYKNDNLLVETNVFTIKGSFKELLSLEQLLENKFKILAKIMSTRFFSVKDPQSRRKNLYLTLITQSFKQIDHANK